MISRAAVFEHLVYPLVDRIQGRDTFAALEQVRALEQLSAQGLAQFQTEKLNALLSYCADNVPYYQRLFVDTGYDRATRLTTPDLSQLPPLTKDQVRSHRTDLISREFTGRLKQFPTSGSTGTPLIVYEEQSENGWRRAVKWRYMEWWGISPGSRGAVVWLAPLASRRGVATKRLGFALNNCNTFLNVADLSPAAMRRFWQQLVTRRIEYLYGYTSALVTFARFALQERLPVADLNLKVVVCTTEMLFPSQRQTLAEGLGAPVADEYGCAELGDLAFECREQKLHIGAHTYLVEVGPPFHSVDRGRCGQAYVTHLHRRSMPFLRYALGDVIHVTDEPCACGRPLPVILSVKGRVSDIITTPSGRVLHSEVFDYIMRDFATITRPAVTKFRAIQQTANAFDLLIVPGSAFEPDVAPKIRGVFQQAFGDECSVDVKVVDDIPPDPSGKFRFFVSNVVNR
ncbi:MAG TPA: hypothetical protein VGI12_16045 [Vicinamibacterales bacterium]|jgi:phenylacetate-CoA ligase